MLRVEYTDGKRWAFLISDAGADGPPRFYIAFLVDGAFMEGVQFVTKHEVEVGNGVNLLCIVEFKDPTTGIVYRLVPQEATE